MRIVVDRGCGADVEGFDISISISIWVGYLYCIVLYLSLVRVDNAVLSKNKSRGPGCSARYRI
jgi:hypothetical protein